ncbi:MAG: acyltransferase, partial [Nitrososphaerota archaeon]
TLIRSNSEIGENSRIGSYTILDGSVRIGKNTNIQSGVYLPHLSIVGNNVFIAPYVCVTNDKYPPSGKLKGVIICDNSIIGANSILISGIEIGENSVIAAGSIVTKNIPSNVVVSGIPARKIMNREEYERKMEEWRKT